MAYQLENRIGSYAAPQLYVNGEFVGGCDILREMYSTGELQQLLAAQPSR
ncbi:MAG: hypothetical protein ACR2HE_03190 [Casimicrobiaceae bacterium]